MGRYCTLELGVSSTDTSCKGSITNTQGTLDLSRQLPMCRQPAEMRDGGTACPVPTHNLKKEEDSQESQDSQPSRTETGSKPPRAAGRTHLVVEPHSDTLMGLQLGRIEPHFHLNNGGTIRPARGEKQRQPQAERLKARLDPLARPTGKVPLAISQTHCQPRSCPLPGGDKIRRQSLSQLEGTLAMPDGNVSPRATSGSGCQWCQP